MFYADGILSGGDLIGLLFYLLACAVAIVAMLYAAIRIGVHKSNRQPVPRKYLYYIVSAASVLVIANAVIELF